MVKVIKYISEVPASAARCDEGLEGCNVFAGSVHVCFEDGTGVTLCKNCFEKRCDEGVWITDATVRLAS